MLQDAGVGRGPGWGVPVQLASLDHLIRSKTAADRPKDRAALPLLQALRDRLEA